MATIRVHKYVSQVSHSNILLMNPGLSVRLARVLQAMSDKPQMSGYLHKAPQFSNGLDRKRERDRATVSALLSRCSAGPTTSVQKGSLVNSVYEFATFRLVYPCKSCNWT